MAPSIGANIRVTGHCNQGRRKYMEDAFSIAYHQTDDERDLEYAFFGIFDGHGGREAALFAKENLMNSIVSQKNFWSDDDDSVLKSIKEGFLATHRAMWKQVGTWPQTVSGLPSTSGTTASVAFIRKGKVYIGHVGDSAIVLGYKEPDAKHYLARQLTRDHKPESPTERKRIENVGGSVINKCGVQRVVWNRPRIGHKGPIRRSTHIDQIPFLAVARSLGDLWSYDYFHEQFAVSPEPDVSVVTIDPKRDRCIILATDGVWNMLTPEEAVRVVEAAEYENERRFMKDETRQIGCKPFFNPSQLLVDRALNLWMSRQKRADNSSVVTVMLDPPGPPRSEVLLRKRMLQKLRPRDESEAGTSMGCDWREPRSRTMMTHAPMTPLFPLSGASGGPFALQSSSLGMQAVPRIDHYQQGNFFTPPPLPPKIRMPSSKSSEPLGSSGRSMTPYAKASYDAPLYYNHPPYHYNPPAEMSAAPSSNLPHHYHHGDASDSCREMIRTAPTPPLSPADVDVSFPQDTSPLLQKPVRLLRWQDMYVPRHAVVEPASTKGILCWPNPPPILKKGIHCDAMMEQQAQDTLLCQKLAVPELLTPMQQKVTVKQENAAKEKDGCGNAGILQPSIKRKLPPGSRELFTLVAKHTRLSPARRGAALWGMCRISSRTHITRSRARLGKAHA